MAVKRFLIIGNPGAGKSTLAVKLGARTNLPVIHLDKHFWQKGWEAMEREKWREIVRGMVAGEKWIIDGNFDNSLDIRLPRAEAVIFLDFATPICLCRIVKRIFTGYGKTRADLAEGCPERIDIPFVKWVARFRRDTRPLVINGLRDYYHGNKLIILKNPRQVDEYLNSLDDAPKISER